MEVLKTASTTSKHRKRNHKSKVKQFYSDFNSESSSSSSSSEDEGPTVFTFNRATAPKLRPDPSVASSLRSLSPTFSSTYSFGSSSKPILSPGLSRNQDIKDVALDMVYQRKIKDLQSTI